METALKALADYDNANGKLQGREKKDVAQFHYGRIPLPDVEVRDAGDGMVEVQVLGVDVFDPQTGEIRSGGTDSIASWFIDTDYDEESFFVRHAYFLGAQDPYKSLKAALRAEIDEEAWASLYRDTSRAFPRPAMGRRIAVKVINHFGDEVMKIFAV